jgi:hypothetical protein
MPNMKSLSWTTKQLQTGHDLLRMQGSIWPWGQNSRLKVTNNGTWHIVWRWSTYMPNMKSLSWTTKVTARTQFVMDAQPSLTLRSKFKVKGHQQWYATHRLEVVYLHAKYAKPVLNDKKVTAQTRFVTDARMDRVITNESNYRNQPKWICL